MRQVCLGLLLLVGECLLAPEGAVGEEVPLATCEAAFAAAPDAMETSECFELAALATESQRLPVRQRMAELLAGDTDNAWLTFHLGDLFFWDEPAKAEAYFRQALALFTARGDARGAARSHLNLHRILKTDPARLAESHAELGLLGTIAAQSSDPVVDALYQIEQARYLIEHETGFDQAYQLLQQAQDVVFGAETGNPRWQRDWLFRFGALALKLDRFREAQDTYRQLDDLLAQGGGSAARAGVKYSLLLSLFLASDGDVDEALRAELWTLADQALEMAGAGHNREIEANVLLVLGLMADGDEAKSYLERCVAAPSEPAPTGHSPTTPAPPGSHEPTQMSCLAALAREHAGTDPAQARRLMGQALALARARAGELPGLATDVLVDQMHLSWEIDPREQALTKARQALAAIEALRGRQRDQPTAAAMFSSWADHYHWLTGSLLASGRPEDVALAFEVSERFRAKSLRDALLSAHALPVAGGPAEPAAVVKLAEVERSLGEHAALLTFLVAPDLDWAGHPGGGSWVLVTTSHGSRAYPLRSRDRLRTAVDMFAGSFGRRDLEASSAARLYDLLLGPALAELPAGIDRLILVPDDALHRLPFAALRRAAGDLSLVQRYQLSSVLSATLWHDSQSRRPAPAPLPALALADPPLRRPGGSPEAGAVLVPTDRHGLPNAPLTFAPLPFARREGTALRRALGGGSLLLEGAAASEDFVKHQDLQRFGIVHFATHSYVDERHPERSAVLLARGSRAENGWLQLDEITRLSLAGRVVVLASCSSAEGELLRGEGLMSLARAFFQAGAQTVVASLQPLDDEQAEWLFARFYDHVAQGESVVGALAAAQREAVEAGRPAAAWANLVVLGDGDVVPLPGGRPWVARHARELGWGAVCAAGVLVLLLAAGVLWRRRPLGASPGGSPPPPRALVLMK